MNCGTHPVREVVLGPFCYDETMQKTKPIRTSDILKKLLTIPGISSLDFSDEPLFRVALQHTPTRYSHSWLYLLRVSHSEKGGLGFKFVSDSLLAVVGVRNGHLYICAAYDATDGVELRKLCQSLNVAKLPILLKKLPTSTLRHVTYTEVHEEVLRSARNGYTIPETVCRFS